MARIHVKKPHRLEPEPLRAGVEKLAERLARELSFSYSWHGDRLEFKRSGANGFIALGDDYLELDIKLGMLLSPLKPTIEDKINDYLDRALA